MRGTRREITARESAREAPEALWEALRVSYLTYETTGPLRDYLLLKGEISRHKELGRAYEAPESRTMLSSTEDYIPDRNPWPLIEAIREKAQQIMDVSRQFGISQLLWPIARLSVRKQKRL